MHQESSIGTMERGRSPRSAWRGRRAGAESRSQQTAIDSRGPGAGIYLALGPWVLFSLIAQHGTLRAAAVIALAGSVAIAAPSVLAGRPKLLELGAILAFAGFTAAAFTADPAAVHWVAQYARAIAAALLAIIAFGSLLFSPFTGQYVREPVPRQFRSSPRFRQINRRLTLLWGCVFGAMVPAHLVAAAVGTRPVNLAFNWAIPIALVFWAARRTAERSGTRAAGAANLADTRCSSPRRS